MTLSSIEREFEVSVQETHRNLNKLVNSNIVGKDSNGNFSLTIFGNMLIKTLSAINFLSKHQKYFSEHDFHDIPIKFIHRIDELEKCSLITGFVGIIEAYKKDVP